MVGSHTVDGNGDRLSQLVTIGANEGGNSAKRVNLQIVLGEFMWWSRVDYLKIKLVGLSYNSNRSGTWVSLCMPGIERQLTHVAIHYSHIAWSSFESGRPYIIGIELSESHVG